MTAEHRDGARRYSTHSLFKRGTLGAFIPAAAGPIVERDTCLYTNTLVADASPDHGNEFIIDRLPSDPRIIVASPCSGHGAKFATAIGEMLAELALDPNFASPAAFRLARFSGFGNRKKASSFLKKRTKKLLGTSKNTLPRRGCNEIPSPCAFRRDVLWGR